jgi:tRNA pseudouridine13 synthase
MKIKQTPEDFQVDEIIGVVPSDGPFALYRLEKSGWTTPDALDAIRRRWQIRIHRLSYGGLKDRHARTTQHLTIERGPPKNLGHQGFTLTYLGQVPEPFTSLSISGNRFRLVVRDLSGEHVERARVALAECARDGIANYFDDQRFGSIEAGGEFAARHMVRGDWEGALKLALTAPYEFDRGAVRKEKAVLAQHWGDWPACKQKLSRGHARSPVDYLVSHPSDFRGALARMRSELASLYLSAYQSHLWNRMLDEWLKQHLAAEHLVNIRLKLDEVHTPRGLGEEQRRELAGLVLPLPSARLKYEDAVPGTPPDWAPVLRQVLAAEQIELAQLKLKGLRRPYFSRGERAALCMPNALSHESGPDERHPGRFKLALSFELPRGSYATLVVKRVTQV